VCFRPREHPSAWERWHADGSLPAICTAIKYKKLKPRQGKRERTNREIVEKYAPQIKYKKLKPRQGKREKKKK
jgi:hypothetical protein